MLSSCRYVTDVRAFSAFSPLPSHPPSPRLICVRPLQDCIHAAAGGRGVLVSTGHSPARNQTARVLLWFAALHLLNDAVLKTPFQGKGYTHTHTLMNKSLIMYIHVFCTCVLQWSWRTLLWGIGLQFIFGLLILRTTSGLGGLQWLGKQAEVTYRQSHTNVLCSEACPCFVSVMSIAQNRQKTSLIQ